MTETPTIVLVHGALTGASVWGGVALRLQEKGYRTLAPALPLRGLRSDAEYLSAFLANLSSSFVLVGHSYGGSVISHPLVRRDGLTGLVFVCAFIQDAGETVAELNNRWPGSRLSETTTVVQPYPGGNELYLRPQSFATVYANDLSSVQVGVLASAQRPIDVDALGESFAETPTWKALPCWAFVSLEDHSLPPQAQRAMAERANASIIEAQASHAAPLSKPDEVAALIEKACQQLAEPSKAVRVGQ